MREITFKSVRLSRKLYEGLSPVPRTKEFLEVSPYIKIVNSSDAGRVDISFSVGIPRKPVLFCGMLVDLEDGMCYFGIDEGVEAIVIARINEVLNKLFETALSVDGALMAVEALRLSGSFKRGFENASNADRKSIICKSVFRVGGDDISSEKLREYVYWLGDLTTEILGRRDLTEEEKIDVNRVLRASGVEAFLQDKVRTTLRDTRNEEVEILALSCREFYRDPSYASQKMNSKSDWLAVSALELADSLESGNDTVLTADLKKKYQKLGFDKVVSGRELSSLVRSKDVIKVQRNSVVFKSDTQENLKGENVSDTRKVLKNSVKQIDRIVVKILKVKEGK